MKGLRSIGFISVFITTLAGAQTQVESESVEADAGVTGFNPNYLLIGGDSITDSSEIDRGNCDIKFQISFTRRLRAPQGLAGGNLDSFLGTKAPIFFSYTQESYWDICKESAPFRETNYRPGLFYRNNVSILGVRTDLYLGYEHESNGRDGNQSKGWDRLYVRTRIPIGNTIPDPGFETSDYNKWVADVTVWLPFSVATDNENITDFSGYGEISATYTPKRDFRIRVTARKGGGLSDWDRGLAELDIVFPIRGTDVQGFAQYNNGYGASLERYDQHEYSLRVGVMFSDFNPP